MQKTLSAVDWVGGENGYLKLIDQTKLPHKLTYLKCTRMEQVASAIKNLQVRGAPAIGVAAGFGLYLGIKGYNGLHKKFGEIYQMLLATRPTAVNLKWALDRIRDRVQEFNDSKVQGEIYNEAMKILKEDRETCQRIGENGARLIKDGYNILTHCNAGLLATAGIGTALAPMYIAKKQGKRFSVYATETRPVLQGARLTVWELQKNHIPVTLICDNMVGSLMSCHQDTKAQRRKTNSFLVSEFTLSEANVCLRGRGIDLVIVGADRIARNGDTANKIGTYQVALLAHHHRIPFYVAAPLSTFDRNIRTGKDIPIEYRASDEVTRVKMTDERGKMKEVQIAPRHTKVYNPAFDITPAKYITGFITETGIHK
ncbi:MAG: S-methyl-5-thioribose-1-phosphate isomerase [Planctomycetota bacterium]